jgi:hypothetical protein
MRRATLFAWLAALAACNAPDAPPLTPEARAKNREALFAEIHPLKLSNCEFERIGDPHDGWISDLCQPSRIGPVDLFVRHFRYR